MKLTKNFTLRELTLNRWATSEQQERTNQSLTPKIISNLKELAENLQVLRDFVGVSVDVSIAFRPLWWEILRGRSGKGQHPLGKAADIKIKGYTPKEVMEIILHLISEGKMKQGGLSAYATFTHYDIRGKEARW